MVSCDAAEKSRLKVGYQRAWHASVEGKVVTVKEKKRLKILLYRYMNCTHSVGQSK